MSYEDVLDMSIENAKSILTSFSEIEYYRNTDEKQRQKDDKLKGKSRQNPKDIPKSLDSFFGKLGSKK
jgi:hypothetical protein